MGRRFSLGENRFEIYETGLICSSEKTLNGLPLTKISIKDHFESLGAKDGV